MKRAWIGRVVEDFEIGDVYEHPLGRRGLNLWVPAHPSPPPTRGGLGLTTSVRL
jgi:hypothetical protein